MRIPNLWRLIYRTKGQSKAYGSDAIVNDLLDQWLYLSLELLLNIIAALYLWAEDEQYRNLYSGRI